MFLDQKSYMFRPVVTIISFYHSTHLRLFYTVRPIERCYAQKRVLMLSFPHQTSRHANCIE